MNSSLNSHVSEEVLEKYVMGRLSEQDCAPVEEHLLVCETCQCRLEAVDEYIRIVRAACTIVSQSSTPSSRFAPVRSTSESPDLQVCS